MDLIVISGPTMYTVRDLSISFGGPPLLNKAQFTIQRSERIALIGRNGEGKSTLMKIVAGMIQADEVEIEQDPSLTIAYLPQDVPDQLDGSVYDVVLRGLGPIAELEKAYHEASLKLEDSEEDTEAVLEEMSRLQHELEVSGGWEISRKVELILNQLKIDPLLQFNHLSGGMKRRVVLGRELIKEPDFLLLDEPTNHLDFESIQWLEEFIPTLSIAILFVTHDRYFLRKISTRILELDRGKLTSFDCDYDEYLTRKADLLDAEQSQNAVFDKKLSQEEAWIRRGIKARRTRNEGRVRALKKLRDERSQRREVRDGPGFSIQRSDLSGRKVVSVENLNYAWDKQVIVDDFSTTIWRGDKIGVIGPNGSGKTTLLKLLLGELKPNSGDVTHGTNLEVVYFDQHRGQLDPELTLKKVVAGDEEFVSVGSEKKHIYSYLSDFLFSPDQARGKVSALSGGEKNRLLLAKIFTQKANVLVMDEPTNDLDLETLELLEELLFDYPATLLLVSHDRLFLNRVVTQTIAIQGDGRIKETVGGYDDYERDMRYQAMSSSQVVKTAANKNKKQSKPEKPRYRTNKEQWELDEIPEKLEVLESRQQELIEGMSLPDFGSDPDKIKSVQDEIHEIESSMSSLMERWEELEAIAENPKKTPLPSK